jgi:hypothetical protein
LLAGIGDELAAGRRDQLRDPGLRSDQWFAPLFVDALYAQLSAICLTSSIAPHICNDSSTAFTGICHARDHGNIRVDVGQRSWGQSKESHAGFQDSATAAC